MSIYITQGFCFGPQTLNKMWKGELKENYQEIISIAQNSHFCLANKFRTEILILYAIKWCIYDASHALLQSFCQCLL